MWFCRVHLNLPSVAATGLNLNDVVKKTQKAYSVKKGEVKKTCLCSLSITLLPELHLEASVWG